MINTKPNNFGRSIDGLMKEFFNDFPQAVNKAVREDVLHYPPVNIIDKPEQYEVQMLAPGYTKADLKVKLEENTLTISAEQKENIVADTDKLIRNEFSLKAFKRSFTINEKIDSANISAKYEDGLLTLTLPKKEPVKPEAKEINIL